MLVLCGLHFFYSPLLFICKENCDIISAKEEMFMQKTQIKDFTKGGITKPLLVFVWPLFLSNLLQVVYNMVDMIVVGNVLGKEGISAVFS